MKKKTTIISFCAVLVCLYWGIENVNSQKNPVDVGKLLTNFEGTGNQLRPPFDGYIYGYTDKGNKGTSTINELEKRGRDTVLNPIVKRGKGANKSSGFLKISGQVTISDKFKYGYAGCGLNFYKDRQVVNLSEYKGIRFYTKGSENYFIVKLEIPDDINYVFHETSFMPLEDWDTKTVYFKDFIQPSRATKKVSLKDALKRCKGIQWQTKGQPIENYQLYLDNIELIK
ncbi:MAG: hypothetical protein GY749_47000 [Desulfobacteraceae bacterium]|nr:hypothetical protein [Desulfobacteraceae bacterium]